MSMPEVETKWFGDFKNKLPKVDGKVFVITGTTSGTGYVAARTAAEFGGTVVVLNRASERSTKSLAKLKEEVPTGIFDNIDCDLQDLASVKLAADTVKGKYPQIFCLANNAGVMGNDDLATKDGYDVQMQTNHLSHFLLVKELLPCLEACAAVGGEARIVNHSSGARHWVTSFEEKYFGKNGGNLGGNDKTFKTGANFVRYAHSKLANAVFSHVLFAKLQAKGDAAAKVKVLSCNPGMSATNLAGDLFTSLSPEQLQGIASMTQSGEDGAMGLIECMMGQVEAPHMYGPEGTKGPAVKADPTPGELDKANWEILWKASEAAVGPIPV
uniref:Uncharacterized protein n=1 Tax=Chromera velia CCMP2878 TaxID=1169474 RepID=A0A0G4FFU3_9ALVE|mmetsp:Transcript_55539/g.108759  ORF Transcript_55539/g.108759 Transcript_55539/m.108759 type:complete len:327 (-) Transcript_55539:439-1419(-)|eukprot:Cvel_16750.t1-p1 / transcript=Cvel_16750.t1 / gene=Cvel_16750 / organism=Chromera_velia_CCMP2878 / gene_product=Uncharacterized oxidoreductase C736.13, putative / transcript_product=Uncharacterized oxidoreductase C736.13, putative / location=Cvel_scaffold1305:5570-6547(-) / protein_length=326 / sequence_SO=supercontig / SO=protein_coding / is_pseudo=false